MLCISVLVIFEMIVPEGKIEEWLVVDGKRVEVIQQQHESLLGTLSGFGSSTTA